MAKRASIWLVLGAFVALVIWFAGRPKPSALLARADGVISAGSPPAGVDWLSVEGRPKILEALLGTDPERLREALREAGHRRLWVPAIPGPSADPERPLKERFSAGGIVRGFRGELLRSDGLLYRIDETEWPVVMSDRVLARVARGILEGAEPPPLDAFPAELQESQPVEVLVVLVGGRGPRLWRSARSPSLAEGVITAAVAARKRWEERSETMGGPLGDRLEQLDVHVALLFDDGTFDPGAPSLIDVLVKPRHGVAYEQPSRWRYLLPEATRNAATPSDAYRRLFRDNGLPEDSFERRDLRLYRMRMETISVDQGSAGSR